jgi:hypothetical protein
MELYTIKKSQRETNLELENLRNRLEVRDSSLSNRMHKFEDRISGIEDNIEDIDTTLKVNMKFKKLLTQNTM